MRYDNDIKELKDQVRDLMVSIELLEANMGGDYIDRDLVKRSLGRVVNDVKFVYNSVKKVSLAIQRVMQRQRHYMN